MDYIKSCLTAQQAAAIADAYVNTGAAGYERIGCQYFEGPSVFSDEPTWDIQYDMPMMDDMRFSVILSDTEQIMLCTINVWGELGFFTDSRPKYRKPKKLPPKQRKILRDKNKNAHTAADIAKQTGLRCVKVDFENPVTYKKYVLSDISVMTDCLGEGFLLWEDLPVIGYWEYTNERGYRDDLIVRGCCRRNKSVDAAPSAKWLFDCAGDQPRRISELGNETAGYITGKTPRFRK